ncbi:fructuronate reductase [Litoreibacter ponti]|uniref:Fructuronate reductase n=1 Tax=Litoreibacter ponti TaxID=1510457 RepID=A0A2T6BMW3_9RHOB|nr:mannitol dehydrogenase family protein [Litoreibacter ponti]PTX57382.1 fructuronate reductase [Litoreibacter ponti]
MSGTIVHLGLGAFFRAHGAIYVADAPGDWRIIGVSLRSPSVRDALVPQGCAYTSVTLAPDGLQTRRIEVLEDVLVAPEEPRAVLDAMAAPDTHIVSLTVTEKGYCHAPATGALNPDHPDIVHDLANPLPKSAPGFLLRALRMRHDAGLAPFTTLSCDNLPDNGPLVRGVVLDLARLMDPDLVPWIEAHARFPATMVDRITPATTSDDIAHVTELTGWADAAPVMHEPFKQWVIEDDFAGPRPDFAAAGAEVVRDVAPYEHMKLRMLNGTHSALAYLGYLAGHQTIAETMQDAALARFVARMWSDEITPTITAPPGVSLDDYAHALAQRYANPAIQHRTWQIAMDGSQKLPQRILGSLTENLAAGRTAPRQCLAVAAWMRYVSGTDLQGQPIDVRDPLAEPLRDRATSEDPVGALLAMREVFPDDTARLIEPPVRAAFDDLTKRGVAAAIAALS